MRPALAYGASAIQPHIASDSLYHGGEQTFSEDCLYLNVWTGTDPDERRPVLMWMHFGAFQFGSSANPLYDGERLSRRGLTVVTINYRLGRMGFLAHPELSAESPHGASGNYGLLDQIAALRWIQDNIAAMGGDPGNVTIAGISAGGHSVHNLLVSPLARGLFHKAIAQSGPGVSPPAAGHGHPSTSQLLDPAERAGLELSTMLGVSSGDELRALPAEVVMAAHLPRASGAWASDQLPPGVKVGLAGFDTGYPIIDGYSLPTSPFTAYSLGVTADVPLIVGSAATESTGLPYLSSSEEFHQHVREDFGERANEIVAEYPITGDADVRRVSGELEADRIFVWPSWNAARLTSQTRPGTVWHYRFEHEPPIPPSSPILERPYAGAFHGADVYYVFESFGSRSWNWQAEDYDLGDVMSRAWATFARTGDPNGPLLPGWPAFTEDRDTTMLWRSKPGVGPMPFRHRLAVLDRVANVETSPRATGAIA